MSGLFDQSARLQAEADESRIRFLRNELSLSFTLAKIAETEYERGAREQAGRALEDAEKGYSTAIRFLTEPQHAKHIAIDVQQELMLEIRRLRTTLDGVHRLKR